MKRSVQFIRVIPLIFSFFFGISQSIDLASVDDLKLRALVGACERAAFSLDIRDVLDEAYRQAWKMDSSIFSTRQLRQVDVVNTGIMDFV